LTEKQDAQATEMENLWVAVKPSEYEKCARCWHHRQDVNSNPEYPGLCGRCVENVDPKREGESRQYA
jgi:isoleucyl-tRNA synthetase